VVGTTLSAHELLIIAASGTGAPRILLGICSFIGYSFAFGLVLQNQFGRTPLQAAAVTFIGPLLGSLIRPVGGRLADRLGGARMAVALAVILWASAIDSLGVFTAGFVLLFMRTGIGNGSTGGPHLPAPHGSPTRGPT